MNAITVRGVRVLLGGSAVLDGVDLDVAYGRVLALVGPNGAGKSTLLGVLTGDVRPHAGEVLLDDRPLSAWTAKELAQKRAVLTQSNQVTFSFTAREVVEMGRAPWPASAADGPIIDEAVARVDAVHLVDRPFPALSGGEKARVSLARVLAQHTAIVLLDEPTAALDLRHQEDVLRLARDLAAAGRAVVVVLHDLSVAAAYADEVAMLAAGSIVAHGSAHEVLTAQRVAEVYGAPVRVMADPDTGRPIILPRRDA
jgi:iron complex transport system ATP-binding protein